MRRLASTTSTEETLRREASRDYTLRLRERPISSLIDEIHEANFFQEEEVTHLTWAQTRILTDSTRALLHTLVLVIEPAIIRLADTEDDELEDLFRWQKEIEMHLSRPEIVAYRKATESFKKLKSATSQREERLDAIATEFNRLDLQNRENSNETRRQVNGVQEKRNEEIDRISRQVESIRAKDLMTREKMIETASSYVRAFERSDANENVQQDLFYEAIEEVKKIDDTH